jgi:hypothetical protein
MTAAVLRGFGLCQITVTKRTRVIVRTGFVMSQQPAIPRCPQCAVPMRFSVRIAKPGREHNDLLFYRCNRCKRTATQTSARARDILVGEKNSADLPIDVTA